MLKVFVINLKDSVERRERVSARLEELGVEFELFEAVDGRKQPHPLFERYDDDLRARNRRTKLSGGELGCFASHFLLWQRCAELDEVIVVMEDDVEIAQNFVSAIDAAEQIIEQLHYVRLAGTSLHRRPFKEIGTVGEFDLVDHIRGPSGTLCYMIHPSAAQSLIEHAAKWYIAVDDYMDRYWRHGVDCFSLMPFVVSVAEHGSDIVRNEKLKMALSGKIRLDLMRRLERLRRTYYRVSKRKKRSLHN